MKKLLVFIVGMMFLIFGTTVYATPGDLQVDGGTAFLFDGGTEVHALTNPSSISLAGGGNGITINDVFVLMAVPDNNDSDALSTTANGVTGSQVGMLNGGDLTSGMEVYGDILGLTGANNSESFTNFTLYADKDVTNFDIWRFELDGVDLTGSNSVTVNFASGPPDGTYVFAYGYGTDNNDHTKL